MKTAERRFTTISGVPVEPVYGPEHLASLDAARDLGAPGEFPYTRGIHRDMYRGKLWTMRQFSGFATPEETNRRYHYLLAQGQTGLSVAFDLPTLMGYDADHALSEGEVGKCGAPVSSLEDMEILFRGIPLGEVSVSMTINSPASVLWAMYLAVAEQQGVAWAQVSGTLQNDILKEYIAQKEYIFPPRPSMRLVTDTIEFGARHTPRFNPVSISGYHIREAGSTAVQELAFTLRDGFEYVDWALERGLAIDEFAPRLSFFFNAHNDFFEEIAKYRAARKIWAYAMRERYGAASERSWKLRFHAQTAGCSLTWQQPYNNVVRTALQAMAAVLGGAQSLHTNSLDEAYALPSEQAVTIALRTQQILAHESGVVNTADPLGGSYFLEKLTLETEQAANQYIRQIDEMGGMIAAIEAGFPQSEIAAASYRYQREVETGERTIVGVNRYQSEGEPIELLEIDESAAAHQTAKLAALRQRRDSALVTRTLDALKRAAEGTENTMPYLVDAVRAYATLGEICDALRGVFGGYQETPRLMSALPNVLSLIPLADARGSETTSATARFGAIPKPLADARGSETTSAIARFGAIPKPLADARGSETTSPTARFGAIPKPLADARGSETTSPTARFGAIPKPLADARGSDQSRDREGAVVTYWLEHHTAIHGAFFGYQELRP